MSETNGPAELPVYSIAEAFVKRSGMYIGQPVTFERVHTFLLGFETAMLYVRDELAREGIIGIYRGCAPTLLRTFCGQAVALSAYHFATTQLANPHTRP